MTHDFTAAYAGRRVLVLGGLGYIGSHLTAALLRAGARVTVVTRNRSHHAAAIDGFERAGAVVVAADIADGVAIRDAVAGREVVFNLAGRSGAVQSVEDPVGDLAVNCAGNLTVLDALRRVSPDAKLVFAGSRLAYGSVATLPVDEQHPLMPLCPHGVHKAAVEQYLAVYGRLFNLRATTLRITNPYGPGQPSDRSAYGVINYLIHQALADRPLTLYGDGGQLRDYVFVDDVVAALLAAGATARSDGRTYNVGSGVGIRMIDAARRIVAAAGSGRIEFVPWPETAQKIETGDFVADVTRIGQEIEWTPAVSFDEGLRRTIDVYAAMTSRGGSA